MPSLREKMKEEMILVGLAPSTQDLYLTALIKLAEHFDSRVGRGNLTLSLSQIRT